MIDYNELECIPLLFPTWFLSIYGNNRQFKMRYLKVINVYRIRRPL